MSTATGQIEAVVPWVNSEDGIGHVGGPLWIDPDRFIIVASDAGPLFVTLGPEAHVEPIAPTFFGLPGNWGQLALGAGVPNSQDFHFLLRPDSVVNRVLLFHSESGLVEALTVPYAYLIRDGRWLELRGADANPAWVRPVDPPQSPTQIFLDESDENYSAWSNDSSQVAVSRQSAEGLNTLRIVRMPETTLVRAWSLGRYVTGIPVWSPNDSVLAVVGYPPSSNELALFVIPVSN